MHDTGTNTSYNTNDTGAPTHRISGELSCAYGTAEIGCSRAFFFFFAFFGSFRGYRIIDITTKMFGDLLRCL